MDMLQALSGACVSSVVNRQESWILSALTDRSYEEGIRNAGFRESVAAYEAGGVPAAWLEQMRLGINGNLRDAVERTLLPTRHTVIRNQGAGQDLRVFDESGVEQGRVESKPLYDLTLDKHYVTTADDFEKLRTVRLSGFLGRLFLAVFFIQLPGYCYGPGSWYGSWCDKRRDQYPGTWGIESQFKKLRRHLHLSPTWPGEVPHIVPLKWARPFEHLSRWFGSICKPAPGWELRPECLKDAAVGIAIWECP